MYNEKVLKKQVSIHINNNKDLLIFRNGIMVDAVMKNSVDNKLSLDERRALYNDGKENFIGWIISIIGFTLSLGNNNVFIILIAIVAIIGLSTYTFNMWKKYRYSEKKFWIEKIIREHYVREKSKDPMTDVSYVQSLLLKNTEELIRRRAHIDKIILELSNESKQIRPLDKTQSKLVIDILRETVKPIYQQAQRDIDNNIMLLKGALDTKIAIIELINNCEKKYEDQP